MFIFILGVVFLIAAIYSFLNDPYSQDVPITITLVLIGTLLIIAGGKQ